jgi:hypothetical protein
MAAGPIGMYFLTVNSIFRGRTPISYVLIILVHVLTGRLLGRKCDIRWNYCRRHGQRRTVRLYLRGLEGRPRGDSGGGESQVEKGSVVKWQAIGFLSSAFWGE